MKSRISRTAVLLATAFSAQFIACSANAVGSTFDSNSDGWSIADWNNPALTSIVGTFPVTWNANGGNPGGYITSVDPTSNWFWFSAPAKFLGDQSNMFGGALSLDLTVSISDVTNYPLAMLTGAGQQLIFWATSPSSTGFTSFTVPLNPSGWRLNDWQNGSAPTEITMQAVLANLTGLYINGDWHDGFETASIDNVQLVPEPPIPLLFLAGGLVLLYSSRYPKK